MYGEYNGKESFVRSYLRYNEANETGSFKIREILGGGRYAALENKAYTKQ